MQVPEEEIRRKLHFWLRMGVVIESESALVSSGSISTSGSRPASPRPPSNAPVVYYHSVANPQEGAFRVGSALYELEVISEQHLDDETIAGEGAREEGLSKEYLETLEKYVTGMYILRFISLLIVICRCQLSRIVRSNDCEIH